MDTWGSLPKSQIDNSTVDEEIAALIAAHEADVDAHLEVGESLQSHKAAEIIDHAAYSIVRDKMQFDRFQIDTVFESIDVWEKSGNCYLNGLNSFVMQTAASLDAVAMSYVMENDNQQDQAAFSQNPNFQITAYFESVSEQVCYIGPMNEGLDSGFGFKVINATLYALYFDDDMNQITSSIMTIASGTNYVLRCMFDPATDTHYFYVNGTEVYSVVYNHSYVQPVFVLFYIQTTNTSLKRLWVANLHFDAVAVAG